MSFIVVDCVDRTGEGLWFLLDTTYGDFPVAAVVTFIRGLRGECLDYCRRNCRGHHYHGRD